MGGAAERNFFQQCGAVFIICFYTGGGNQRGADKLAGTEKEQRGYIGCEDVHIVITFQLSVISGFGGRFVTDGYPCGRAVGIHDGCGCLRFIQPVYAEIGYVLDDLERLNGFGVMTQGDQQLGG